MHVAIGVQGGIEGDVVTARVDVSQCQPGQRTELLPALRLFYVELDSIRIDFALDGVEGEVVSADLGGGVPECTPA